MKRRYVGLAVGALLVGLLMMLLGGSPDEEMDTSHSVARATKASAMTSDETSGEPNYSGATAPVDSEPLVMVNIALSLSLLTSLGLGVWLYRSRKLLLNGHRLLAPEDFAHHAAALSGVVRDTGNVALKGLRSTADSIEDLAKSNQTILQSIVALQHVIDDKDRELSRYRAGYDNSILQRYLSRFVRVSQAIEDSLADASEETRQALEPVNALLHDALDECGVERFCPDIDSLYDTAYGVADRPRRRLSDDAQKVGRIAEILEHGYHRVTSDGYEIVCPAKVVVFAPA